MKSANTKPDQIANTTTNVPNSAIPNIPNKCVNIIFLSFDYCNIKRLTNTSQALLLFN